MKDIGYGAGYAYDHNDAQGFSGQDYWPDGLAPISFYTPAERGFEARIAERLRHWQRLRDGSDG